MKRILFAAVFTVLFYGCEVLKTLPQVGGGITEMEATQGIQEALSQGLVKAVLQLNK